MPLQVEIWQEHLVGGIFAANPHMDKCVNADQYVLKGKWFTFRRPAPLRRR